MFRSEIKRKTIPDNPKDEKEKERINEFVEIIKNKYFEVIFSMKTQISYFLKKNTNLTLLNENDYEEQIKYSKEILKGLNHYMKEILSRKYLKKDEKYYITLNLIDTKEDIISKYIENNKNKIILSKNELHQMLDTSSEEYTKLKNINNDYKDLLKEIKNLKKNKSVNDYFV